MVAARRAYLKEFVPYQAALILAVQLELQLAQARLKLAEATLDLAQKDAARIREAVAAEHQAELDAQKQAAETEIRELREQTQAEIAAQIRSRLLALASRKRS